MFPPSHKMSRFGIGIRSPICSHVINCRGVDEERVFTKDYLPNRIEELVPFDDFDIIQRLKRDGLLDTKRERSIVARVNA